MATTAANVLFASARPEKLDRDHLFEKLHGKDPYVQVKWLETLGLGTTQYELTDIV